MDGKMDQRRGTDSPIAKPDYPLPMIFNPSKLDRMPTHRKDGDEGRPAEKAHFYRKATTESGAPVYDFYVTTETSERPN